MLLGLIARYHDQRLRAAACGQITSSDRRLINLRTVSRKHGASIRAPQLRSTALNSHALSSDDAERLDIASHFPLIKAGFFLLLFMSSEISAHSRRKCLS
jgi:hypothetical protein